MSDDADRRAEERVGTVLNEKWALERLLGIGGMAAVYAARHRNGARAAVKVLHADLSRHSEVRERFQREGYAANRVEHPGVVKVLDDDVIAAGPDAGTAYLVMELLDGESLQDRLERPPPMSEREILAVVETVLDVLEAAHARGVVHRDLKPENLFLLRDEVAADPARVRVKVLDFGLARLLQGQAITSYGLALGTPSFMSPEQAAGRIDEIDGRTDLFALAATAFRIRTGRRIHEGANPIELITKMANVAAPPIRKLSSDVTEPFARVIDRALEFRREDRYKGAAAMRNDVARALAELDAAATVTWLAAAPAPPLAAPVAPLAPLITPAVEATIEVSAQDLERTRVRPDRPPYPVAAPSRATRVGASFTSAPDDSIRIPRRRSVLPWLALLLCVGVGAKLAVDARHRASRGAATEPTLVGTAALPPDGGTAGDGATPDAKDSAPSAAPANAPRAATTASTSPGRGVPAAAPPMSSGARRGPPVDVGPGNVHKIPSPHHRRTTNPRAIPQ